MDDSNLPAIGGTPFELLKKTNTHGVEYWSARDIQSLFGYSQWRRFESAIQRSIKSCEQSGNVVGHHFASAGKPIKGGKGAVQSVMFGIFHDAGYKGLYGGLGSEAIKSRKRIPKEENLLDRMDSTELAANQFRMTQARDKLARQRSKSQEQAIRTHEQVGREVRTAIQRIGGTMPENIPPAEHIKQVEHRVKESSPKLELDEKDAKGLTGQE